MVHEFQVAVIVSQVLVLVCKHYDHFEKKPLTSSPSNDPADSSEENIKERVPDKKCLHNEEE